MYKVKFQGVTLNIYVHFVSVCATLLPPNCQVYKSLQTSERPTPTLCCFVIPLATDDVELTVNSNVAFEYSVLAECCIYITQSLEDVAFVWSFSRTVER